MNLASRTVKKIRSASFQTKIGTETNQNVKENGQNGKQFILRFEHTYGLTIFLWILGKTRIQIPDSFNIKPVSEKG